MSAIDVVIVTYDRSGLVHQIVNVLERQTVKPGIIIADDGSPHPVWSYARDRYQGVAWQPHNGYQRVKMFNAGMALVGAPYAIVLDDDQIPETLTFVETYLRQLKAMPTGVVRGLGINGAGQPELPPFFSTANIGFSMELPIVWRSLDMRYNGHYGLEDRDLGRQLRLGGVPVEHGVLGTQTLHVGTPYGQAHPHVDLQHNEQVYQRKWGDLNG